MFLREKENILFRDNVIKLSVNKGIMQIYYMLLMINMCVCLSVMYVNFNIYFMLIYVF